MDVRIKDGEIILLPKDLSELLDTLEDFQKSGPHIRYTFDWQGIRNGLQGQALKEVAPAQKAEEAPKKEEEQKVVTTASKEDERAEVKAKLDALGAKYNTKLGLANLKKLLEVAEAGKDKAPAPEVDINAKFREMAAKFSDVQVGLQKCMALGQKFGANRLSELKPECIPAVLSAVEKIMETPGDADAIIAAAGA